MDKDAKPVEVEKPPRQPCIGDRVIFYLQRGPAAGKARPGVVVAVDNAENGVVDLQVFTRGTHDGGHYQYGIYGAAMVYYSSKAVPGTWEFDPKDSLQRASMASQGQTIDGLLTLFDHLEGDGQNLKSLVEAHLKQHQQPVLTQLAQAIRRDGNL
jgi:hypothetical protein